MKSINHQLSTLNSQRKLAGGAHRIGNGFAGRVVAKEGWSIRICKLRRFGQKKCVGQAEEARSRCRGPRFRRHRARAEGDVPRLKTGCAVRAGRAKCNERFTEHAGVRQLGRTAGCICTAGVCRSADLQVPQRPPSQAGSVSQRRRQLR